MPAKIMIMKVMAAATAIDPLVITEVVPVMVPVVITEVVPVIVPVVVFALSCEDKSSWVLAEFSVDVNKL